MNKLLNIIFTDCKKNKNIYFSLIIVVIISLIFGTLFITILEESDKTLVSNQITNFFDTIKNGNYVGKNNILPNFLNSSVFIVLIWILGLSIIGIPVIICLLFYKGFTLAFTISSLIYSLKIKGIFISFIYIFPHLILNLIMYFIITYYSFNFSIKIFNSIFYKKEFNYKKYVKKYLFIILISIIILILTALYETYIMPYIMPYIIKLIY